MFKRRRPFAWSTAIVAVILLVVFPYVMIDELWTFDTADRVACVLTVAFFITLGLSAAVHAFRGKPFEEIGE